MGKDVIIACDFSSKVKLLDFLNNFQDEKLFLKIGMELFYAEGTSIIEEVKRRGHKVFLDLKLHDIPNTVMKATSNIVKLGIDIMTIHSAGTINMMKASLKGAVDVAGNDIPIIAAITQLTSTSEEVMHNELLINDTMENTIIHYASNAKKAGLNAIVCSPLEAGLVKEALGKDFITITPGIRFDDDAVGDQVRVTTPKMAAEIGSDYIVVGRTITNAVDPVAAYKRCYKDFVGI